ncbi:MAG: tetratricopeptide repeat protein [Planctomycetota bacterium]
MSADPRAKQVFLDALDQEPSARAAFVERACAGDEALAAAVRGLLGAHTRAGRFLAGAPDVAAAPIEARDPDRSAKAREQLPVGARLRMPGIGEAYEVVRPIDEGGFGAVYLAQQLRPLQRTVALKVIKRGMDSHEVLARFEAERQALARMDHPSIARVFDAGETDDGRPFFVMEYVDGVPIHDYVRQRDLGLGARLRLIQQVCRAVQHAHQKGVLHRDLKPSNVLVADGDQGPVAKVIDFGIQKAIGGDDDQAPSLRTRTGQLVGTPSYMSPEQAAGSGDIDTRSDVHAIGLLLYELLTGAPAFAPSSERPDPFDVLRRIREEVPPRPSDRLTRSLRSGEPGGTRRIASKELRAELDWIAMRCLAKDRAERYPTAVALAEDLERFLRGRPVEAGPPSTGYLLRKFVRRHRLALGVAAAFVGVAITATIVSIDWAMRADRARVRAEAERAKYAEIAEFSRTMLASIEPAVAAGQDTALVRQMLDRSRERLDRGDMLPNVEAALQHTVGFGYLQIAELELADAAFARALELHAQAAGSDNRDALELEHDMLVARLHRGKAEEVEAAAAAAAVRAAAVLGPDAQLTLRIGMLHGVALDALERWEEAEALFRDVLARQSAALGAMHDDVLTTTNNLAILLLDRERPDEAIPMFERLLAAQSARHPDDHPKVMVTRTMLAKAYGMQGRHEEALPLLQATLAQKRRVLPEGHPSLIIGLDAIAGTLRKLQRIDEAVTCFREAIDLARRHRGEGDRQTVVAQANLALLLLQEERFAEALELYERLWPHFESMFPASSASAILVGANYAEAELGLGRVEAAAARVEPLAEAAAAGLGDRWQRAFPLCVRGRVRTAQGRFAEAEQDLLAAHAVLEERWGGNSKRLGPTCRGLRELYTAWQRPDDAARWEQLLATIRAGGDDRSGDY